MAVEMATATRYEIGPAAVAQTPVFSAIAVFDGRRWSALCRELGIASDGDNPEEALANLKSAVREAIAVADEKGIEPGRPVADDDLLSFLLTHQPPESVYGELFAL